MNMKLYFSNMEDPRQKSKTQHDLLEIIAMTIIAVAGDCVVLCQDLAQNKVRNFRDSRGSEYRYAGLRPDPRFIALALGA